MKKIITALLMSAFFIASAYSRDWVSISNNTEEELEIVISFSLGLYLQPYQSVEFTYGDKVIITTKYGLAAEYWMKGDFTIELLEDGYYVNNEFHYYWTES